MNRVLGEKSIKHDIWSLSFIPGDSTRMGFMVVEKNVSVSLKARDKAFKTFVNDGALYYSLEWRALSANMFDKLYFFFFLLSLVLFPAWWKSTVQCINLQSGKFHTTAEWKQRLIHNSAGIVWETGMNCLLRWICGHSKYISGHIQL